MNEILKELKLVDWNSLKSASNLKDIPDNIINLISEDNQIRESAYWNFDNKIVLQGELYESAFYLAPFLLQLLIFSDNNEKNLDLLFEISNGVSFPNEIINFKTITEPFLYYRPDDKSLSQKMILEDACKFAIACKKEILIREAIRINKIQAFQTIMDIFLNLTDYEIKKEMRDLRLKLSNIEKINIIDKYIKELEE